MNSLKHVAIILDGNGRWAKKRGFLKRLRGHEEGALRVREITTYANQIGLEYLTLYAFSTENWKRDKEEVGFLFKLLERYLATEFQLFVDHGIRFETIGDLSRLSEPLQDIIYKTKELTKNFTGLTQVLAINYGSQDEIVRAVNKAIKYQKYVTTKSFEMLLDTAPYGSVDLLIRTGGNIRISNFLLWQCAYAEMFFENTLWPDFTVKRFEEIIRDYKLRDRRFGGVI